MSILLGWVEKGRGDYAHAPVRSSKLENAGDHWALGCTPKLLLLGTVPRYLAVKALYGQIHAP